MPALLVAKKHHHDKNTVAVNLFVAEVRRDFSFLSFSPPPLQMYDI
ncbi:MAG TPA: hypothetical protein VNK25_03305 [Candidatus Nitrosotenuis sp.]|jgi:hypothetical protein|nr:hypothetical protein [Candidatus Nitrosotenuis sp.]